MRTSTVTALAAMTAATVGLVAMPAVAVAAASATAEVSVEVEFVPRTAAVRWTVVDRGAVEGRPLRTPHSLARAAARMTDLSIAQTLRLRVTSGSLAVFPRSGAVLEEEVGAASGRAWGRIRLENRGLDSTGSFAATEGELLVKVRDCFVSASATNATDRAEVRLSVSVAYGDPWLGPGATAPFPRDGFDVVNSNIDTRAEDGTRREGRFDRRCVPFERRIPVRFPRGSVSVPFEFFVQAHALTAAFAAASTPTRSVAIPVRLLEPRVLSPLPITKCVETETTVACSVSSKRIRATRIVPKQAVAGGEIPVVWTVTPRFGYRGPVALVDTLGGVFEGEQRFRVDALDKQGVRWEYVAKPASEGAGSIRSALTTGSGESKTVLRRPAPSPSGSPRRPRPRLRRPRPRRPRNRRYRTS